jgi:hypothetical protein
MVINDVIVLIESKVQESLEFAESPSLKNDTKTSLDDRILSVRLLVAVYLAKGNIR